jgi:uncharacterized protein (TIGR00269 family)|tara:strand:- start:699 stop:1646 length:948 start_codon:yes stop_codon:yes gene_type:complete
MVTIENAMQKCSRCKKKSVYHRAYSGERFCSDCFKASIIEKTRKTISNYNMMKHGDTLAVAVSGGKDSLSLIDVLHRLTSKHREKIIVITVDEGIEEYRDEAVKLSSEMVSNLGLEQEIVSFKSLFGFTLDEALECSKDQKISSCSICGILRRRAIDLAAKKVGADVVVTGHNLDDFLQTYFINLTNGDMGRLEFLSPFFESQTDLPRRVKPFIEIYEEEIAFYAYLTGIPFQSIPCPYMNEGIRTEIRSFLNKLERSHSGIKYNTYGTVLKLLSGTHPSRKRRKCDKCGHPSSNNICSSCRILKLIQNNLKSLN